MKKIAIFSAARSDFGILKNIIIAVEKNIFSRYSQ